MTKWNIYDIILKYSDIEIAIEMEVTEQYIKFAALPAFIGIIARIFFQVRAFIFINKEGFKMDTRVATVGIILENQESAEALNAILHDYGRYIVGRMGIPYRDRKINVICIVMDAPQDAISAMSGKIGKLDGVSAKTAYSSMVFHSED